MRKVDAFIDLKSGARSRPPCRARKIAKAVDGNHRSVAKRRDMKSRDQVRPMMFDRMARSLEGLAGESFLEQLDDASPFRAIADAAEGKPVRSGMGQNVSDLSSEMRGTQLVDGDV